MQVLAPGGGFVFNQIHNILPEITPERVLAMFDAAGEFGTYPIKQDASPEELEKRYVNYWSEPLAALNAEGFE